jgi:hypothetical protein
MALGVVVVPTASSFMLSQAQTLERIAGTLTGGGAPLMVTYETDPKSSPGANSPVLVSLSGTAASDLFYSIELGIKFPAGTQFKTSAVGNDTNFVLS